MAKIEINGIEIEAREGSMVIEAADDAGIVIPRFCYHKKLSIAANCRMCLVEVEKAPKPLPACATPVTDGMKVFTNSPKAIAAQKAVMEFLLINHPLDCPVCDQGGECDLQEMAMGFGNSVSRYAEGKRVVADKNIGPLIATDMTRCIHCTRCVRFGQEIAGMMEFGAPGRGEHTHIQTYLEDTVDSELSGNVIDLCPVGALTSKPYRFTARPWELVSRPSISPHDCVGANLRLDIRGGKVMRALPQENEAVNELWLADRDRFSYTALAAEDRLTRPQLKENGQWREADWDEALPRAAEAIRRIAARGADGLGAMAGYTSTTEEFYLLQKLVRGLGSGNVDHRLRQQDFRSQDDLPPFPWLGQPIAELEQSDAVLLVGANLRKEQPLLATRLRKAANGGAAVMDINPVAYPFNFPLAERITVSPAQMVEALAAVARALLEAAGKPAPEGFDGFGKMPLDEAGRIAGKLRSAERATLLLGALAAQHPAQAELRRLATLIAELSGARVGFIAEGGNAAGAWLAGAVPHRGAGGSTATRGKSWPEMLDGSVAGFLLLNTEPELECLDPERALSALQGAETVVALTAFDSPALRDYADVLLPIALFPETSGTLVNGEGRWQSFTGCVAPAGEARPAWKVLRVLGNLLAMEGFEYASSEEVREELRAACAAIEPGANVPWRSPELPASEEGLLRVGEFPLYATDPMVRRSAPLQQTADAAYAVRVSPTTAKQAGIEGAEQVRAVQGEHSTVLPLVIDGAIAEGCVLIPTGCADGLGIGFGYQTVRLESA